MEKSLLLEKKNRNQWISLAGLFTINGFLLMSGEDMVDIRLVFGVTMIMISILYITFSFVGYSVKSKYAAKIRITENNIELKASFWKPSVVLNWPNIKSIQLGNYKVEFELERGKKTIIYDTTAEKSIQLKQLLRESAERHGVEVNPTIPNS